MNFLQHMWSRFRPLSFYQKFMHYNLPSHDERSYSSGTNGFSERFITNSLPETMSPPMRTSFDRTRHSKQKRSPGIFR